MTPYGLFNYIAALLLILFGIYVMMTQRNLVRKVIGMVILQSGVILFFITLAFKWNAAIPIIPEHGEIGGVDPAQFANPLPHALMLTAIVVGVSTLGVALVLIISIYRSYRTIEEDEILKKLNEEDRSNDRRRVTDP